MIAAGARLLGLSLTPASVDALNRYVELVRSTNTAFNLVSRRDVDRLETRHVLDCLALVTYLQNTDWPAGEGSDSRRLLDVGSGAGFPGIVLAIACPDLQITLVDRSARKHRFLQRVVTTLDLANVMTKCHDVVEYGIDGKYELITSRAVAPVEEMWSWLVDHLVEGGLFIHMSFATAAPEQSTADLPNGRTSVVRQDIPGLKEPHWLTVVRKETARD